MGIVCLVWLQADGRQRSEVAADSASIEDHLHYGVKQLLHTRNCHITNIVHSFKKVTSHRSPSTTQTFYHMLLLLDFSFQIFLSFFKMCCDAAQCVGCSDKFVFLNILCICINHTIRISYFKNMFKARHSRQKTLFFHALVNFGVLG